MYFLPNVSSEKRTCMVGILDKCCLLGAAFDVGGELCLTNGLNPQVFVAFEVLCIGIVVSGLVATSQVIFHIAPA